MSAAGEKWDISHLRSHIQGAVDLEFWTIPFYISSMYSIKDRTSSAYQLMRSVVNQEMLHLQSAANIANAYGFSPTFAAPVYTGTTIPHIDLFKDNPQEVEKFYPYTATIGPLDLEHINGMCLVELPESLADDPVELKEDLTEYGTIGEFYRALRAGAAQLIGELRGGVNQVDAFSAYYRNAPELTITESGDAGFDQVGLLMSLITDQGEGPSGPNPEVLHQFQNTADDPLPGQDHFAKFVSIKDHAPLPDTFSTSDPSDYDDEQQHLESILVDRFTGLRNALEELFSGQNPSAFFPVMAGVGGAIRNCWERSVTPRYS